MIPSPSSRAPWSFWLSRAALAIITITLMLCAIWAGLLRLGWALPSPHADLAMLHGPLLVCGVLGTIIGLERAVAIGRPWAFSGSLLTLAGGIVMLLGAPIGLAIWLIVGGSLGLLAVFAAIIQRQPARYTMTMALGAVAWLGGNLFWLAGRPLAQVSLWWASFLVLTIVGERLELGRLRQLPPRAVQIFSVGIAALLASLLLAIGSMDLGMRLAGGGLLILGVWLLRYDIARRTIRRSGLPRFSAICILSGGVWLTVSGIIATFAGAVYAGPIYDALLHTIFVGFVFTMIFGHAPIVIPALLNLKVPLSGAHYAPLAALHLSLLLRVTGDLTGMGDLRRWGGLLNAVAILAFLGVMAVSAWHGRQAVIADAEYASN